MKRRRFRSRRIPLKLKICAGLLVFLTLGMALDYQMRPLIKKVAESQARNFSVNVINNAIVEELDKLDIGYADIVTLEKDKTGNVIAITTDMKKVNLLKSTLTIAVQEKLLHMGKKHTAIPLGTLTGTEIFNGHGPKIPLKISMSGSLLADLRSEFVSVGINQIKHQLILDVRISVFALIPGYPITTALETQVMVAETVLVGEVPNFFAKVE